MNSFQLPYQFKKLGYYLVSATILLMLVRKILAVDLLWVKVILKNVLLISMLIISISKEKIEDEFIKNLRSQSYRLGCIITILYAILQPIANYLVDLFLNKKAPELYSNFSYFQVLVFMMLIQIAFFEKMKRLNK